LDFDGTGPIQKAQFLDRSCAFFIMGVPLLYLTMETTNLRMLLLIPGITFALLLAWLPLSQAYWDAEVRRLCAIEGGTKVYETVTLSIENFDPNLGGELRGVDYQKHQISVGVGYAYSSETHFYKEGSPDMRRSHYGITRNSDGKLMGETTLFSRRGGDFLYGLGSHPSSFGCPTVDKAGIVSLIKHVFVPIQGAIQGAIQ